jgi:hypothetical protein
VLLFHSLISEEITTLGVRLCQLLLFVGCNHARHASRGLRNVLGDGFVICEYYVSLVDHFHLVLCLGCGGLSFLTLRLDVVEHVSEHFFVRGDVKEVLGLEGLLLHIESCRLSLFWINNRGV